jgi:hypothetical protein
MMRNINLLQVTAHLTTWLLLLGSACRSSEPSSAKAPLTAPDPKSTTGPALDTTRIVIVGASVSAGFGGAPFGDVFKVATKGQVESVANVFLFRDPIGESAKQLERAIELRATTVIAIDFLFWDLYGATDPAWRDAALDRALAGLERVHATGAWIVLGDVPHVVTAAEWMLPRAQIPDEKTLAAYNAKIAAWANRERVLFVPFAAWAAPLANNELVEIARGEKVEARSLLAADGLHANALGVWFLLDKLDHFIEQKLPGTHPDALVFVRPK